MPGRAKPMAPDFKEYALAHTIKQTRAHYAIGHDTFWRYCERSGIAETIRERGGQCIAMKKAPADFADHAHETNTALMARFGASNKIIVRWRKETGAVATRKMLSVPERFVEICARMFRYEAAKHFRVSEGTIARWADETGATFRVQTWKRGAQLPSQMLPQSDSTTVGRAAQWLRRWYPVYRADVRQRGLSGYFIGSMWVGDNDLIARATAKGWDATEWSRINGR